MRREEIIVVYLTVWKVCGKVLDAVSLGFSFSGKGEREVLNKIDSFQIFSVKRKNNCLVAHVAYLGCHFSRT